MLNGRELAEEVAKIIKQRGDYNSCVNQLNKLNVKHDLKPLEDDGLERAYNVIMGAVPLRKRRFRTR